MINNWSGIIYHFSLSNYTPSSCSYSPLTIAIATSQWWQNEESKTREILLWMQGSNISYGFPSPLPWHTGYCSHQGVVRRPSVVELWGNNYLGELWIIHEQCLKQKFCFQFSDFQFTQHFHVILQLWFIETICRFMLNIWAAGWQICEPFK